MNFIAQNYNTNLCLCTLSLSGAVLNILTI